MWRAVLIAGGLFATAAVPLPAATAAPAESVPAAVTAAPGAGTDHPVQIEVNRLEPRILSPGAVITIAVTLRNTGDATVAHLGLRLQRGAAFATRAELAAADDDPDPDTTAVPSFTPVPGQLQPGGTTSFTYTLAASALQLDAAGVYPALLNANGTVQGTEQRVGELHTYLIEPPTTPTARTTVAWLWPLADRTHRDASGRFTDDDLAREVAANGRLDRALTTIERLPRTTPPGGTQQAPTVPVTLAIDPALVEELQIMAAGSYRVGSELGKGTQAAAAFLQRLKAVAATVPVVALPYGDVDADALQSAGMPGVVTRSLPGTADGTALDDRGAGAQPSASPSADASAGGTGAGAQFLAATLGVHPRTDLAWLPSATVHPDTLGTLQNGGMDEVVLPASALTGGDEALGLGRPTATAATSVTGPAGALAALVGDGRLGKLADADSTVGGPRVAEQRYLAELTLLSTQAPATGAAPTVLIAPPRTVDADPDTVAAMMAATTTAATPWLQAATAQSLVAAGAGAAGTLAAPSGTPALDPTGLATLAASVAVRNAVADAAVRDPAGALAPYDAAIARAASIEWWDDVPGFRRAARDVRTTMNQLADRVTLVAPADGTYSLASNDAPLVLTVRNDLPFAVQVLLQLRTTSVGLQLGDIGKQTLLPGQRTTLQVPTQVRHLGGFSVTAALITPRGAALGDPVRIRVKTTAYGSIGVFITIGAAALLGLLFLRRLIRFLRRRRGGPPSDGLPGPSAEGAAVPQPPTRSPV